MRYSEHYRDYFTLTLPYAKVTLYFADLARIAYIAWRLMKKVKTNQAKEDLLKKATFAAIFTATFLVLIKMIAWILTGAISLQATLIDSMIDTITSTINYFVIRESIRPPDEEHRWGHGKIEALAAIGQSAFIFGSAIFIVLQASRRLIAPEPIAYTNVGIWIMVVTILVTFLLLSYQRYVAAQTGSIAIKADSAHYMSDFFINMGVILSLLGSKWFDWHILDPLIGVIVSFIIVHTARKILLPALDILLDRELAVEDRIKIEAIARSHPMVRGVHDLRTRSTGAHKFIQLHLEMCGDLSLYKAHEVADEVENSIRDAYPDAEVLTHQDLERDEQSKRHLSFDKSHNG